MNNKEQQLLDKFTRGLKTLSSVNAPKGLAQDVIRMIRTQEKPAFQFSWNIFIKPVFATVMVLVIIVIGAAYFMQKGAWVTHETKRIARFEVKIDSAQSIVLVGDFNKWDKQASVLKKGADGKWFIEIKLNPGNYQYQFLVDGSTWTVDPDNPVKIDDGFGGYNSGIEI